MNTDLINYLKEFVTEQRFETLERNARSRTRYFTVGLENIYQPHNASAVLRTCDCFGIQDVHIIENDNAYEVNPDVTLGSNKWLNMHKYNEQANNTKKAITQLKEQGYRIVATTPHTKDVNLEDFDIHKGKAAFFFGTELNGLSLEALDEADEFLKIPMHGFTESFNISVSAAIIMHHLSLKLRQSDIAWQLSETEQADLILQWLKSSIKNVEGILENYNKKVLKNQ